MPEAVFCILRAMTLIGDISHRKEIANAAGYETLTFVRYASSMIRAGFIVKPFAGKFAITEKGKIALAIEMGRRSKFAYNGLRRSYRCGTLAAFEQRWAP